MKNITKNLAILFTILALNLLFFTNCNKDEFSQQNQTEKGLAIKILEQETKLGSELILPAGTKVARISESEIKITLPSNFKFLLYDENEGVSYTNEIRYTCTCSANGSCPVIYSKDSGYGCLQGDCNGSCTGTPKPQEQKKTIYGVVNTQSKELLAENFIQPGHLTPEGTEIFFDKIVKEKLMEFFDIAYTNCEFKNSTDLIANKGIESTTKVLLQYMGISFSAVVPNFDDVKDAQLINFTTGNPTCEGSNGCECFLKKKCIIGYCVYICSGCNPCSLEME